MGWLWTWHPHDAAFWMLGLHVGGYLMPGGFCSFFWRSGLTMWPWLAWNFLRESGWPGTQSNPPSSPSKGWDSGCAPSHPSALSSVLKPFWLWFNSLDMGNTLHAFTVALCDLLDPFWFFTPWWEPPRSTWRNTNTHNGPYSASSRGNYDHIALWQLIVHLLTLTLFWNGFG